MSVAGDHFDLTMTTMTAAAMTMGMEMGERRTKTMGEEAVVEEGVMGGPGGAPGPWRGCGGRPIPIICGGM